MKFEYEQIFQQSITEDDVFCRIYAFRPNAPQIYVSVPYLFRFDEGYAGSEDFTTTWTPYKATADCWAIREAIYRLDSFNFKGLKEKLDAEVKANPF